jgi:5S rRNA maturation endonuclease (ribonuclease M5)
LYHLIEVLKYFIVRFKSPPLLYLLKMPFDDTFMNYIKGLDKSEFLFIVEGPRDRAALESLGFENIFVLNKPNRSIHNQLFDLLQKLRTSNIPNCVILTDLDEEGNHLYAVIKNLLETHGFKTHDKFRKLLYRTPIRQIEGLTRFSKSFLNNLDNFKI